MGGGGTGGAGGSAVNPDPCDPIQNDCVEAVESKCTITTDADNFGIAACEAPLGEAMLGEDCVRVNNQFGHDTCAAGLFCTSWPKPLSNPIVRECVALCDETVPCADDQACVPVTTNPYGVCLQKCKPFDGSCGSDPTQACDVLSTVGGGIEFACLHSGSHPSFDACQYTDECPVDHSCRSGLCRPYCDDAHLCAEPSDACVLFSDSPAVADFGSCFHADDACLGSVVWAPPVNAEETVTIVILDAIQGNLIEGATVKACAADDLACAAPLGQATSDAGGNANVLVPTLGAGFDGYFEITAPGFLPELLSVNTPIAGPGLGFYGSMVTKEGVESAFVGSAAADLSRALFLGIAYDCAGIPQGGAVFSIDTADGSTLLGHARPSFGGALLAPDTVDPAATSSQAGGFLAVNVPVGKATISVQTLGGQTVADAHVPSRAGAVTLAVIAPAP